MFQSKEKDKDLYFEHFLKLTLAVYKVTAGFPQEGKDLQVKIRETANGVLVGLLSGKEAGVSDLLDLFQAAAEKDWVDPRNFLILRKEYQAVLCNSPETNGKMQRLFSENKPNPKTVKLSNGRQKAIYDILKQRKKIQLRDLRPSFPQVSRRTLIRDLEDFCQAGIVVKNGTGPSTSYIVTQAVTQ